MELNKLTGEVIGAAIEVHKALGLGLLETAYEECLCFELDSRGITYERQKEIPVRYKGHTLDKSIISLKVFSVLHFNNALEKGFSFYRNIEREGITL